MTAKPGLRITGGEWRGRRLCVPAGLMVRPTSERVRESVFNILTHRGVFGPGAAAADLFAGSGAMGLEALSRGVATCTFVETARPALAALEANIKALGAGARAHILRCDARRLPPVSGAPFSLVFLDAPYERGLTGAALDGLRTGGRLAPGALCVVELAARETLRPPPGLDLVDERGHGRTRILFLEVRP